MNLQPLTAAQQKAAESSVDVTGGKVDYIIANAAYIPTWDMYNSLAVMYIDKALRTKALSTETDVLTGVIKGREARGA